MPRTMPSRLPKKSLAVAGMLGPTPTLSLALVLAAGCAGAASPDRIAPAESGPMATLFRDGLSVRFPPVPGLDSTWPVRPVVSGPSWEVMLSRDGGWRGFLFSTYPDSIPWPPGRSSPDDFLRAGEAVSLYADGWIVSRGPGPDATGASRGGTVSLWFGDHEYLRDITPGKPLKVYLTVYSIGNRVLWKDSVWLEDRRASR